VKSESDVGKTGYGTVREKLGRCSPLLAGNDTVPVSVCHGGGMCCAV